MRVPLLSTAGLDAGVPQPMFQTGVPLDFDNTYRSQYAATKDGQQFLVNVPAPSAVSPSVTIIVNWLRTVVTDTAADVKR